MKKFLAIYTGSPEGRAQAGWESLSDEQRQKKEQAGIAAWHQWVEKNKASIVDVGAPLGRTKSASKRGLADIRNQMTGYTLVQAESHEAAVKLFVDHPHFTIFPGEAVEVMECLAIPGM